MRLVLFCQHSSLVAHLETEVAWLKIQLLHERTRAEHAIDLLLAVKVGLPSVSTPVRDAAMTEVEKLLRDDEFVHAGDLG